MGTGAGSHRLVPSATAASMGSSSVHTLETHQYFSCREVQTHVNMLSGGAGALGLLDYRHGNSPGGDATHVCPGRCPLVERAVGGKGTQNIQQGHRQARAGSMEIFLLR